MNNLTYIVPPQGAILKATVFTHLIAIIVDAYTPVRSSKEMSSGISLVDPTLPARGRILRRWNLRVNAALRAEGVAS